MSGNQTTERAVPGALEDAVADTDPALPWQHWAAGMPRALTLAVLTAMLIALLSQIPVTHTINVGSYDAGYLRGFHDPERTDLPNARAYLNGSDGSARWSQAESYLLLPQAGLPATIDLRMRGHPAQTTTPITVQVNGVVVHKADLGAAWVDLHLPISGGLTKSEDVLITIQAAPRTLGDGDPRLAGALLDRAIYRVGPAPILPYPSQLLAAALLGALLALLRPATRLITRQDLLWLAGMGVAFLLLVRFQLPAPLAPWRGLLLQAAIAACALLLLKSQPHLVRIPRLSVWVGGVGIVAWVAWILVIGQNHLVLSMPGVEKDFRVFATRDTLATIAQADGFYNMGYPLLIWLVRPFSEQNPFLAARLIAACAGGLFLLAGWRVAARLLGPHASLIALIALALNPFTIQYALYLGSDMPFAALCMWVVLLLLPPPESSTAPPPSIALLLLAGGLAGMAFLVRHPGLVLIPLGWFAILLRVAAQPNQRRTAASRPIALFSAAALLAILPQIIVNLRDTGQILYSQQAKNIWLAVFGNSDWGRWGEVSNEITLAEVVLQDPGRFLLNLALNLQAFVGTGAQDTSEFGRAIQLRLLSFPANWLALAGLVGWIWQILPRREAVQPPEAAIYRFLLAWIGLYLLVIAVGFTLPRFFLPLVPVYALACGWAVVQIARRLERPQALFALGLLLVALLWGTAPAGASYVLDPTDVGSAMPGQPRDTLAVARTLQGILTPGEQILLRIPPDDEVGLALSKYSAIAHHALPAPASDDPAALQSSGAAVLVWSDRLGDPPAIGQLVERIGPYSIIRMR
jgi:hypothetical protein